MSAPPATFVADPVALADTVQALAEAAAGGALVALDTEFHAERRYRPLLLLVQLALPDGRAYAVDPLACDLSPLAAPLARARVLVHGGRHDLALLYHALGIFPAAVLDTQRAAALLGHHFPMRLDDLVAARLGRTLPHGHALSDWQARPLDPAQLRYATQDVHLLHELAAVLLPALATAGRERWAWQASAELRDEALLPLRPLDAWRTWDVAPGLSAEERAVLHALTAWREQRGAERDQPPWHLLGDSVLLQLARARPRTLGELAADRRLGASLGKRHGVELVGCIAAALTDPATAPPAVPPQAPARRVLLQAWAHGVERALGIGAGLALPPALLARVAEQGPDVVTGWRDEALGTALRALWRGEAGVGLVDGEVATRVLPAVERSTPSV